MISKSLAMVTQCYYFSVNKYLSHQPLWSLSLMPFQKQLRRAFWGCRINTEPQNAKVKATYYITWSWSWILKKFLNLRALSPQAVRSKAKGVLMAKARHLLDLSLRLWNSCKDRELVQHLHYVGWGPTKTFFKGNQWNIKFNSETNRVPMNRGQDRCDVMSSEVVGGWRARKEGVNICLYDLKW